VANDSSEREIVLWLKHRLLSASTTVVETKEPNADWGCSLTERGITLVLATERCTARFDGAGGFGARRMCVCGCVGVGVRVCVHLYRATLAAPKPLELHRYDRYTMPVCTFTFKLSRNNHRLKHGCNHPPSVEFTGSSRASPGVREMQPRLLATSCTMLTLESSVTSQQARRGIRRETHVCEF
jgi:hypothetical protein